MNEYTPTTDELRAFIMRNWAMPAAFTGAAFDRWLRQHDAEVAAQENERLADMAQGVGMRFHLDRADRIRREVTDDDA